MSCAAIGLIFGAGLLLSRVLGALQAHPPWSSAKTPWAEMDRAMLLC
jgi:hypothetical protein